MPWIIGNVDIGRISQRGVDLDLPGMQADVAALQAANIALQADIATLQADVTALQADVAAIGQVIEAWDAKGYTTSGGSSIAGIQTRTLNTLGVNTIPGASLAANQITLPTGTYRATAYAPAGNGIGRHQAALWNVTDNEVIGLGMSCYNVGGVIVPALIIKQFTLTATKVIEVRHYTEVAVAGAGLGVNSNANFPGGTEIFSFVRIEKVS